MFEQFSSDVDEFKRYKCFLFWLSTPLVMLMLRRGKFSNVIYEIIVG